MGAAACSMGYGLRAQEDCAPPAGTAVDFVVPKLQNLVRKSVAELTTNEVARLRLAYQKLRDLTVSDPSDPRGWMQQAQCALLDVRRIGWGYSRLLDILAVAPSVFVFS